MPPANDNWASATVITGSGNHTTGTNIGATAEGSEPANNGKTVWFKWTCGTTQPTAFFTIYDSTAGAVSDPRLKTVLQVFTGASVGALTEETYFGSQNWKQRYGNWEFGSYVVINAISGTTYYIRVDGVAGAEGNFSLSWGQYFAVNRGGCSGCPPMSGQGWVCLGALSPDVTTIFNTLSYGGSLPAGPYYWKYCGGAYQTGGSPPWEAAVCDVPSGEFFQIHFNDADNSGTRTAKILPHPAGADSGYIGYNSQAEAEQAFQSLCPYISFHHSGGDISVDFTDPSYADNVAGTPNPIFGLYRLTPVISAASACAGWTSIGVSAACTFVIHNANQINWENVTITLSSSGGISSPSAPQTGITLTALSDNTLASNFTFNCSTSNVIATITLTCPEWASPIVLTYNLAPIISVVFTGPLTGGTCSGKKYYFMEAAIYNDGYFTVVPTGVFSLSAGLKLLDGLCNDQSSISLSINNQNCHQSSGHALELLKAKAPGTPTASVFTCVLSDTADSFGTFTDSITIPN